jgi:DNA primase
VDSSVDSIFDFYAIIILGNYAQRCCVLLLYGDRRRGKIMPGVVDEIKERISIVDVVGQRVSLKKSGRSFKALCPFHNEKTPSFYVFPDSGTFKCFGCGAGGDIFGFLMRSDNIEFPEALRTLADRAGVNLRPAPEVVAEDQERGHLREVISAASVYFHNLLLKAPAAQHARDYLQKRGMTQTTMEGWQAGYALESWDSLQTYMVSRGFKVEDLAAAGLVIERDTGGYYDRFRNRIMFPIHDIRGGITGFGARALGDAQPKYMNSPQSILFDKSATLFGIEHAKDSIRQSGQAVIVEGYMDVLIPHQMGITNIVASLGTALTPRQIEPLKRLGKSIILALDADAAGDEATLRGLEVARDVLDREAVPVPTWRGLIRFEHVLETDIRVLALPRGKDPDEVVLENPDNWKTLVAEALPVVDFYFNSVTARLDLRNARDKAAAADRLLPIIGEIVDDVVRSHYMQKLAGLVQVDERTLTNRMKSARPPAVKKGARPEPAPAPKRAADRTSLDDYCLAMLLNEPMLFWKLPEMQLTLEDFPGTENRQIFVAFSEVLQDGVAFDLDALKQRLDPTLYTHVDELVGRGSHLPQLSGEELELELAKSVLRARRSRLREQVSQMTFLWREAQQSGDAQETTQFSERVRALHEEIDRVEREIEKRTELWKMGNDT